MSGALLSSPTLYTFPSSSPPLKVSLPLPLRLRLFSTAMIYAGERQEGGFGHSPLHTQSKMKWAGPKKRRTLNLPRIATEEEEEEEASFAWLTAK